MQCRYIEVNPVWYVLRSYFFAMIRVLWFSVKLAITAVVTLAVHFLTNPLGTFVRMLVVLTVVAKLIGAPLHR